MNWPLVPQAIVTGLLNGGVLGLIALGLVLIYKSSEVFTFAQGSLLMLGAFVVWWFAGGQGHGGELFNLPWGLAVMAALVVAVLVGFLVERLTLRPMAGQPLLSIILMTLGLAQFIEGVVSILQGMFRDTPPASVSLFWLSVYVVIFLYLAAKTVERKEYVLEQ